MNERHNTKRWAAYMISCEERLNVRKVTLGRLAKTDWPWGCKVICSTGLMGNSKFRQEIAAKQALQQALTDGADYILFLEDDLHFNKHLYNNIAAWSVIPRMSLASLYNPGVKMLSLSETERCSIAAPEAVFGSQCFLISKQCARFIVRYWTNEPVGQDIKFARIAGHMGMPIYYHRPSLVQHDASVASTWGGFKHQAQDYDEEFRTDR